MALVPARYYSSGALATTLASSLGTTGNPSVTSIAGLPASYPYTMLIDWGLATQEAISVTGAPSGGGPYTLPCTRGIDGSTGGTGGIAHNSGAIIVHGVTAQDFAQPANYDAGISGFPWEFNVAAYGAKGDGQVISDATISGGSLSTLTSASGLFTSADTGKSIMINGAGPGGGSNPSGALITTIAGFTNSTTVTLTGAASGAVTVQTAVWGTDDTAAIQAAMAAASAYTGFLSQPYYAELVFPPAIYIMAGNTVKGGSTLGNALIPLPVPDVTDLTPKRTIVIRGARDNSSLDFWIQKTPNLTGACIVAMKDVTSQDPTWGPPSIIGGPTVNTSFPASGGYNNILAVIDGMNLVSPENPGWIAYDFFFLCQYAIHRSSANIFWAPNGLGNTPTITNTAGLGLRNNRFGTNNRSDIDSLSIEGYYFGLQTDQHVSAWRLAILYSNTGVFLSLPAGVSGDQISHGCWFGYLSIEVSQTAILVGGSATPALFGFSVGLLDTENINVTHISDPNNGLTGTVNLLPNGSKNFSSPVINGAGNLEILAVSAANGLPVRGAVTAPGVPATTVALQNPFWRHAWVTVTSGGAAVTGIAVDGAATGLTLGTTGTVAVRVPSGKTITLTYASTAPTWAWWLD